MHFTPGFKKGLIKVCAIFQHGVYDDKKLSGKGNDGLFRAFLLLELPVPSRQVTVTLARNDPSNLTKHIFDIRIALSDGSVFTLACALIVAGRESCQEQICSAVLKGSIFVPISAMMEREAVALMPGMVMSCSTWEALGEASLRMAVSTLARWKRSVS